MIAEGGEMGLNRSIGAVVTFIGLVFLLGAGLWISHHRRFMREATKTSGRVIANVANRSATAGVDPPAV